MTARQHIKNLLASRKGYVPSSEIHRHLCRLGYQRSSSDGTLSKMVARGEVIRRGTHQKVECRLNARYRPSAASLRQTENHSHLTPGTGLNVSRTLKPERRQALNDNAIFDLCRQHSRIYRWLDLPVREVRT